FSQPSVFISRAFRWLSDPAVLLGGRSIYHHLLVTLEEMAGGFVLGVLAGVVVGFLLGRSAFWSAVFNPYIQILNALPRLDLAPAQGLGWIISQAQGNFDAAGVYAGMLILCIVVVIVEFAVTSVEGHLIQWKKE